MSDKRLSVVNSVLLALIIIVNGYIIIAPLLPGWRYWQQEHFNQPERQQLTGQVEGTAQYAGANKLVVPRMFLDEPVLEGPNIYTANKGIWRLPSSSTPDKGGNTVLIGHRFLYSRNQAVFYNLDKIQVGDKLAMYWENQRYTYQVSEIKVVSPQQTDIEAPTEDARLTLYTCTPLWTSKNRLVVTAKQIGSEE